MTLPLKRPSLGRTEHELNPYLGFRWDNKSALQNLAEIFCRTDKTASGKIYIHIFFFVAESEHICTVQSTLLSLIDYGDVSHRHSPACALTPLAAVCHSALRFLRGDGFRTRGWILYVKAGRPSPRRDQHCILIYWQSTSWQSFWVSYMSFQL